MSVLERYASRRVDLADSDPASEPRAPEPTLDDRGPRPRTTATAVVPAIVIAFGLSLWFVDLTTAVLSAASIGGLVALVAVSLDARGARVSRSARLGPPGLAALGAAAGLLVGAGAAINSAADAGVALAGQVLIVWFCLIKVSNTSFRRLREGNVEGNIDGDIEGNIDDGVDGGIVHRPLLRRGRLVRSSAFLVALTSLLAWAVGDIAREAAVVAFAVPIALALFWAGNSDDGLRPSRVSPVVRAALAGATAAAFAAVDLPTVVTTTGLAAIAVVALGSASITRRTPRELDRSLIALDGRTGPITLAALAVACGVGAGALPVVALVVALAATVVNRPGRPAPQPAPSRSTAARVVTGLTVGGFLLRTYTGRGLWLDETTSVFQAKKPFVDMIRFIGRTDNHPPLHHIVMWLDIRLVGDSAFALRLPMMLMGAALIPMVYLIGREFFDRRVGVYAAAFTTVAPIAVWYGQEARMYSQFMLLAAISVYSLARILRTGENRWWVIFTLSSVMVVYTQYFAVLHVAGTFLVLVIEVGRRLRERRARSLLPGVIKAAVVQAVLLAPLLPYALNQAVRNQEEGFGISTSGASAVSQVKPPPGIYGFLTNLQWVFFGYLPDDVSIRLVALWPIGLLILLLLLGTPRRTSNRILLTIAGVPMAVVFGISFFAAQSRSLAEVRYFSGAVPLLLILLAAGVVAIIRTARLQFAAVAGVVALMSVALVVQQVDDDNPRLYQYQEAVEQIRRDAEPGDRVLYAPEYFDYTLDYYDPTIPSAPLEGGLPALDGNALFIIGAESFADSAEASNEVTAAIDELEAGGGTVEAEWQFAQVNVWKIGTES